MTLAEFSAIFTTLVNILVTFVITLKYKQLPADKKNQANIMLSVITVSIMWGVSYFLLQKAQTEKMAYFWFASTSTAYYVPVFFLVLCRELTKDKIHFKWLNHTVSLSFIITTLAVFISYANIYYVKYLIPEFNGTKYMPVADFMTAPIALQMFIWLSIGVYILIKAWPHSNHLEKHTYIYMISAFTLGLIGGGSNFLLYYEILKYPWPNIFASLFPILLLIGITRRHIFNIKFIAAELLGFSLLGIYIFQLFSSVKQITWQDMVISIIIIIISLSIIHLTNSLNKRKEEIEKINRELIKREREIKTLYIKLSENTNRTIDALEEMVFIVGGNGRVYYINESAQKMFSSNLQIDSLMKHIIGRKNKHICNFVKQELRKNNEHTELNTFLLYPQFLPIKLYCHDFPTDHDPGAKIFVFNDENPSWSTIYNSDNFTPLDQVVVRLLEHKTNRILKTIVTDELGRFSTLLPPGQYDIIFHKNGFSFPSKKKIGYIGTTINNTEQTSLKINVMMDPIKK